MARPGGDREPSVLLFDLEAWRFYIFNLALHPHDLIHLTVILQLIVIALLTSLAARFFPVGVVRSRGVMVRIAEDQG